MAKQKVLYPSLDTPAVLVDMDILEANIREMSELATEAGINLRPHVKVHESAWIAKEQIKAGAGGIEVGPIAQAEAMAEQGLDDIVIAHPGFYGGPKGETLKRLLKKHGLKLTIVVDMLEQAEIVSQIGQAVGKKVPMLIKIDLGICSRYGVLPGEPTLSLAEKLCQLTGIEFLGIYGHEMGGAMTQEGKDKVAFEAATVMTENARMLRRNGIKIEHVSVGASSTFRATCRYIKMEKFPEITEIHPGSCVIGDMTYVRSFAMREDRCALTVLTNVMSTSHPSHAVLDCGAKTFGADVGRLEAPGFGSVKNRPDLLFGRMSNETSCVYYMDPKKNLSLGDRLEIVPKNAIVVINIHDQIYGVRAGAVERVIPVTGRGRGN